LVFIEEPALPQLLVLHPLEQNPTLTANWIIAGMNLVLGKVFNKIGEVLNVRAVA